MRSLLGEETEVVAEHNRVIRMNVSPSLLAKLNSCPAWGLEVVRRSQNTLTSIDSILHPDIEILG